MSETAGLSATPSRAPTAEASRKVVGKNLLAVSAAGMLIVLVLLCRGDWVAAITAFALTVAALEIMLHRALARFEAPAAQRRRPNRPVARTPPRPAAAIDQGRLQPAARPMP